MTTCHQWLASLPAPSGILQKLQRRGRDSLGSIGLPNKDLESWRLTDLSKLKDFFKPPSTPGTNYNSNEFADAPNNAARIVLNTFNETPESSNLPPGVEQLSAEELESYLGTAINQFEHKNDWQVSLNEASTTQLIALKVKENNHSSLELIIQNQTKMLSATRVLIVIEEAAKLELLQVIIGSADSAQSHVVEMHLSENAEVNHGFIALGKSQASLLANIAIEQKSNSSYALSSVVNGWTLGRLEPQIMQKNGNARTKLRGLQISSRNEQLETHSLVHFDGPEGYLDQLQKAAAAGNSHCIFNGVVNVPRVAQKTNATQMSRNLLLSKQSRIDTKPELTIIADDVQCAHGATVSQLQEDELFYLCSRGINIHSATAMLLKGYCSEILNSLPIQANRWEILNELLENI